MKTIFAIAAACAALFLTSSFAIADESKVPQPAVKSNDSTTVEPATPSTPKSKPAKTKAPSQSGKPATIQKSNSGANFSRGSVGVVIGTVPFNQRYVAVHQAWVDQYYFYWTMIPDLTTGRLVPVRQVGYYRRLVWVYYDRVTGLSGYFDAYGNAMPWPQYSPRW